MRKLAMAFVVFGLVLSVPAFAVPALTDEPFTGTPGGGGQSRTNDCPGTIVWDTGMFDNFTPPTGCATAGSAGCFVQAINDGAFPADGRRMADDFFVVEPTYITHVKIWARYNLQGYDYHLATPGSLHGFCVKFYEQDEASIFCPDGTVPGETAIGAIAYDQYTTNFVEYEITTGLIRNFNYCITLPTPFLAQPGKIYFVSASADFDFTSYGGGVTQWFNRMFEGAFDPYCEASWWDTWNSPETNWNAISIAINQPCWTGWNIGFVLYSNYTPTPGACCFGPECVLLLQDVCTAQGGIWYGGPCTPNPCPPVPVEQKSWGQIKNEYR